MKRLAPLAGILVFLAVWEAGVRLFKVPPYLMPPPSAVFLVFVNEFQKLLYHGWVTTYEMLAGYALAVAVAVPLAIAITSSERFDRFITPQMLFFQVVPKVAIAPLFLVWFGVGATPEDPGGVPDLLLPDRDRRRRRPALDVGRDARPRALHGRFALAGVRPVSPARPACRISSAG